MAKLFLLLPLNSESTLRFPSTSLYLGMQYLFKVIFLIIVSSRFASAYTINIVAPKSALANSVSRLAIEDFRDLLIKAGAPTVSINEEKGDVVFRLPEVPYTEPLTFEDHSFPYVQVPVRHYEWSGKADNMGVYTFTLKAPGATAISAGLYGLLHELLGFHFYHPRESKLPDMSKWDIYEDILYTSKPRFNKMGFHLHTQHPLELTEALLNEDFPGGEQRVREYIDWLVRNRQNYFEFCLLETINRKTWPAYSAKWVQYALDKGVIPGLDLSLHMKQQVAYKLYRNPHRSFRTKKNQIKRRINELTVAGWKVFNMEFSQTEFSSGNTSRKAELRNYVQQILDEKGIHLTGREHVVKPETMVSKTAAEKEAGKDAARDAQRGVMIHTVMFYSLNDSVAPVYGNRNLHHMRDMMLEEMTKRETWYYPESAYWITFDISVPMFLSPYLDSRLEDILYCDSLPVEGHLTFSSGWEWGYWLVDWSIANWSWNSVINDMPSKIFPEQYYVKLYPKQRSFIIQAGNLMNDMLKERNLIQFLTAATVTDELPGRFKLPLHPMPEWTYKWLLNEAPEHFADSILKTVVPMLQQFTANYLSLRMATFEDQLSGEEITDVVHGMDMVASRAYHRSLTLSYICKKRMADIRNDPELEKEALKNLEAAAEIRKQALDVVRIVENKYRYPQSELTTQHPERTAYHFGYLFPAHNLHFWLREEEQARQNKWSPFFMNIWNIARIIGLKEK